MLSDRTHLSGTQKAAILCVMLGEDSVATIFQNLPDEDLHRITEEVSNMGHVPVEVTISVLEEYQRMMEAQEYIAQGGHECATRLLIKAFGEVGAKSMVERLTKAHELSAGRIETLKRADPQHLARFLSDEHPQTIALILGHLEAKQASAVLMDLEQDTRADVVRRLANLRQLSPEVTERVTSVLNRRLRSMGDQGKRTYSGFKNVAELMNRLDSITAREILENIEKEEPKLAMNIRDLMFTFDDFIEVPEPQLRELMGAIDKKTLTLALKGAQEDLRNHFFRTMSSRAIEMLKEDSDLMGPVRSRDVAKAQAEIVAIARKLESEARISLKGDGDDQYVL
ncbi:flagellar motor switch protein FliG [Acidobacteria bacterium AB60]|nr:flagellar motor switch protein FliG [Acidobacteria bacterium AB60]